MLPFDDASEVLRHFRLSECFFTRHRTANGERRMLSQELGHCFDVSVDENRFVDLIVNQFERRGICFIISDFRSQPFFCLLVKNDAFRSN
jgi:hypothetical protein